MLGHRHAQARGAHPRRQTTRAPLRAVCTLFLALSATWRWLPTSAPAAVPSGELSWGTYLTQSFYHATIVPLLIATVVLAYLARPSTTDEFPAGFRKFQVTYLAVWALCVAADWLQGPFVYALYADYGFSEAEIAQLFVAGFGSSLVFGCFVGTFADKFGRKRSCLLYCAMYILSCSTKHCNKYSLLMVGRIGGGIATSLLFSCFECWMVSEHLQRHKFSGGLLGFMFGLMYTIHYMVAIATGFIGQVAADAVPFGPIFEGSFIYAGGKLAPFELAILCLIVAAVLIALFFEENYGNSGSQGGSGESPSLMDNIASGASLLAKDRRVLLMCPVVAFFEAAMFTFVYYWTPSLDSEAIPPPHGVIFSLFMMSCMCGASAATLLGDHVRPAMRLLGTFFIGFAAFAVVSVAVSGQREAYLRTLFAAFLTFEFCCGVYFPSVGVLKSDVVPEQVRGTVYNMYRVPLNAIVVSLLLSKIAMATVFKLNALLLLGAFASIASIGAAKARDASQAAGAGV